MVQYVIMRTGKVGVEIFGDRKGQPFTDRVNAQRSLTKRKNKSAIYTWEIKEVQK